ncbi:MAG: ankyrin repeat domain-containing protein [bacterium]
MKRSIELADIITKLKVPDSEEKAFFHSCYIGDIETVREMLWYGFNPNIQDSHGKTPLIIATQAGHIEIVRLLLANHADITIRSHMGWTALQYSVYYLQPAIAQILQGYGAEE